MSSDMSKFDSKTPPPEFEGDLSSLPEGTYSGDCPYCGTSFYMNVRKSHYGYCSEHKVWWPIGSGLFSSWLEETEEEWERNAQTLSTYAEVKPWHRMVPDPPVEPRELSPEEEAAMAASVNEIPF